MDGVVVLEEELLALVQHLRSKMADHKGLVVLINKNNNDEIMSNQSAKRDNGDIYTFIQYRGEGITL